VKDKSFTHKICGYVTNLECVLRKQATGMEESMKEIKGTTKVCGLIGNPVAHSISPLIHNNLAEFENIDLAYVTFKVESGKVAQAVKGAYELDIFGLNVTVPHKNEVIDSLVDIDPLAKNIGAVNTLVRVKGGFKGYNTDIFGLQRQLNDANIELAGNDVIILGAGGAARAIVFLCAKEGAKSIYILNRTLEKAQQLANEVNAVLHINAVIAMQIEDYNNLPDKQFITIQTTSVGLHPNENCAPIENPDFYDKVSVGVDIIYNPTKTKFMKLVENKGKIAYNGLKMLLYQGVCAFELWNEIKVSEAVVVQVYEQMKKELNLGE